MGLTSTASVSSASGSVHRADGPVVRQLGAGPSLYAYVTRPAEPRAVVGLLHGFADYGGRYRHVADAWAEQGIATVAIDMRGHGRAEGRRGYCDRFQEYIEDAAELAALLRRQAPGLAPFLFGHSFGGLVAASSVIQSKGAWRGLALTSPNMAIAVKVPLLKKWAGQAASKLLPGFGLPAGLGGRDLTHDAAIARAYDSDPLVFKNARARWFTEMIAAQERAMADAQRVTIPLYIVGGTADRVTDFGAERAFFDAAGSTDKTFDVREGLFHEVLNEPEWPDIARRMADWMLAHAS
ncbi:MAG: lysophospholipase [Polyangiaceae bacterium]|jgi:alpha-beta hydrolase superfamily lysophospholipase